MTRVLVFDVGKTGCRAALFDGEERVAEAVVPGRSGVVDPDGARAAVQAMRAAGEQVGAAVVDAICAGLAGFASAQDRADQLASGLSRHFDTSAIALTSDMATSHAGALDGRPGVVIVAGTGAVALGIDADGASATCDGWGYLLGDDGSGYAIGRAGLSSAVRASDGRGGSTALLDRARRRFGTLRGLPALIHGADNPPRLIASFARDVHAAATAGDEVATGIWRHAGRELARTAAAAAHQVFAAGVGFDMAATGGLFAAGPLLTAPFEAEVTARAPAGRLVPCSGDALDGGRLIAMRTDLPHAALTVQPRRARRTVGR